MKKEVNHLLDVFNNFSVIFFNQLPFYQPLSLLSEAKGLLFCNQHGS